jgi:hypothetical protein
MRVVAQNLPSESTLVEKVMFFFFFFSSDLGHCLRKNKELFSCGPFSLLEVGISTTAKGHLSFACIIKRK